MSSLVAQWAKDQGLSLQQLRLLLLELLALELPYATSAAKKKKKKARNNHTLGLSQSSDLSDSSSVQTRRKLSAFGTEHLLMAIMDI